MNNTLVFTPDQALRPGTPVALAEVSPPRLATPRGTIATWRERIRFRWELAQMARGNPPFWRG